MPTMAENWLTLRNGSDAWFAIEHSTPIPNPIHHDVLLAFTDGSAGYLGFPVDPANREAFIEAHRSCPKYLLTQGMLNTIMAATNMRIRDIESSWFRRLFLKKEIALCRAYLETLLRVLNGPV